METEIKDLKARIVFNSRGEKAFEVDVVVGKFIGRASAPAGASTGGGEAVAFPMSGPESAIQVFKQYSRKIIGFDASDIRGLTMLLHEIDPSPTFNNIGGAAVFAISVAAVDASSKVLDIPMFKVIGGERVYAQPYPLGNVLGGGKHAGEGSPDIQEFLSLPTGARRVFDAIYANILVHKEVRRLIEGRDPTFAGGKGDEGAWAPHLTDLEALEVVDTAVKNVGDRVGFKISMGLDFASSSIFDPKTGQYSYSRRKVRLTREQQIGFVLSIIDKYSPAYVEDPMFEEDFEGYAEITKQVKHTFIVGDDLFVTNSSRLLMGAKIGAGNGVILKVNQVGPLGDAIDFANTAKSKGYVIAASHRSGESVDPHLAHIALGVSAEIMKSGAVGGERVAKLNELIRVDELYGPFKMMDVKW
ncbi:MAG: phosphopyruvate hydratase [Nitrososphaeria archaeon]